MSQQRVPLSVSPDLGLDLLSEALLLLGLVVRRRARRRVVVVRVVAVAAVAPNGNALFLNDS